MQAHKIIGDRLRQELSRRGMTAVELARAAGVKTSFLYDILNGKSANPSTIKLGQVAVALGVSLAYLAGMDSRPTPKEKSDYTAIPWLGEAGDTEAFGFSRAWLHDRLHAGPEAVRLMQVRGDGMAPTLQGGDTLLVDTARTQPSPPGIFVLDDGVGIVAKRIEMAGVAQTVRILSDNPKYGAYERTLSGLRIIGRVVWFARAL